MAADKLASGNLRRFWLRYSSCILAGILAFISLPPVFTVRIGAGLDNSWIRAINFAVNNHLVFGRDFLFTYGPLGFLNTRNSQYMGNFLLLAGDLFLLAGLYYILCKILANTKGWLFVLLIAVFLFKGAHYIEGLYLVFIVFVLMNLKNNFSNYFELIYCALSGVLLFFIKVNYGLVSTCLLMVAAILLLVKDRKTFLLFFPIVAILFISGCWLLYINIPGYIRSGTELIRYYDEAMRSDIQTFGFPFLSAISILILFLGFMFFYLVKHIRVNTIFTITSVCLFSLSAFLLYKNGFTRSEYGHNASFFSVFPLFIACVFYILDFSKYETAKTFSSLIILVSSIHFVLPLFETKKPESIAGYINPAIYLEGIFENPVFTAPVNEKLSTGRLADIGKSTVDIFPHEIASLLINNLNYSPRPVPQSYAAYSGYLDSLNARHFCNPGRPELLMMRNESIDNRYPFWDESATKAAIRLNYNYLDNLVFSNLARQFGKASMVNYLMLKAKTSAPVYPVFEKTAEQTIHFEERVSINFPDSIPVYMTVDMDYNALGLLIKYIYQPPAISMTLYPDSSVTLDYRIIKPIIKNPVLINKFIGDLAELKNFMAGNLKLNKDIKGFMLHSEAKYFKPEIKITYYRLANY